MFRRLMRLFKSRIIGLAGVLPIVAGALVLCVSTVPAKADKVVNPVAVFSGLDKITGRIITFEVGIDETVQFGALQITPRVCYSRPATESPNTTSFVEVDEVMLDNKINRIFSGWMFASSPGLHGVEHPVFDVWLLECKGGTKVIPDAKPEAVPSQGNRGSVVIPNPGTPRQVQPTLPNRAAPAR